MNFLEILQRLKRVQSTLPQKVGQIAVNHFLEAFAKEGLEGQRWVPRKDGSSNGERVSRRGLLIKSGTLRRSIRVVSASPNLVVIGTDVPYAQIHNEGGVTHPRITSRGKRTGTTKKSSFTVNIPARPFMKITPALQEKIKQYIINEFRR